MKQTFLLLFAWGLATSANCQSQESTEAVLGSMQALVTNALPDDPTKALELLPMLAALSNQVEELRTRTDDAIRLTRQYAEQIKPTTQAAEEKDPTVADAYQKIYRELMGRVQQSTKMKKQLDAIAGQIAARIECIHKNQSSSTQPDKK